MSENGGLWRPAPRPGTAWVVVEGDVVAIDELDRVHLVSGTGALLWQLLDGTASVDDLALDVAEVFKIEADAARRDVEDFVREMAARGLVTEVEGTTGDGSDER